MDEIVFDSDPNKAAYNIRKHGVSFAEAQDVFFDDKALFMNDPDHSDLEDRFLILGMSRKANILTVCHCFRENDLKVRIISARKANRRERNLYFQRR